MNDKEIGDLRNFLLGSHIRITNLALSLHREQERILDMIRILDAHLIKGE